MTLQSERILVVDDQTSHRNVVAFNLANAGYKVSTAANAPNALTLAEHEHFDLIITDYYMPDYTGTDLIRGLRETDGYASTPIILLTARANELNLQQLRNDLSVLVVSKPCSMARLLDMVSKCLAIARTAR